MSARTTVALVAACADPPVRADGRCACGCGKRLRLAPPATMPKALRAGFAAELATDPFASTMCCRRFHGCELPNKTLQGEHMASEAA